MNRSITARRGMSNLAVLHRSSGVTDCRVVIVSSIGNSRDRLIAGCSETGSSSAIHLIVLQADSWRRKYWRPVSRLGRSPPAAVPISIPASGVIPTTVPASIPMPAAVPTRVPTPITAAPVWRVNRRCVEWTPRGPIHHRRVIIVRLIAVGTVAITVRIVIRIIRIRIIRIRVRVSGIDSEADTSAIVTIGKREAVPPTVTGGNSKRKRLCPRV